MRHFFVEVAMHRLIAASVVIVAPLLLNGCCCCLGGPGGPSSPPTEVVSTPSTGKADVVHFTPTTDPRPPTGTAVTWPNEAGTSVEIGWYDILDRQVEDSTIKTQVELRVLVNRDATGDRLRKVLEAAYASIAAESGFKYHPHPNSIWVFAYTRRDWQNDSTGWIGKVQQAAVDRGPTYQIAEGLGDLDSSGFASRVQEACPVGKDGCIADAATHSVRVSQVLEENDDPVDMKFNLWFGLFFSADSLFGRLPDLEKVDFEYTANGEQVVKVGIDRATNDAIDWDASQAAVGREEQKLGEQYDRGEINEEQHEERRFALYLKQYRGLLKKVPSPQVPEKYRP